MFKKIYSFDEAMEELVDDYHEFEQKVQIQINNDKRPDERLMRPEVADAIIKLGKNKFIGG